MKTVIGNSSPVAPIVPAAARRLWGRWIIANALGELLGLGLVAAIGAMIIVRTGEPTGAREVLSLAALMVTLGAIEGLIVGYAQWRAFRAELPAMTCRAWTAATAGGAFIAWLLGMIPSTIMNLRGNGTTEPAPDPSAALMLSLAALMGLALGLILALPQWLVLRRQVRHAGWWLPANALAWSAGMPVIFGGIDLVTSAGVNTAPVVVRILLIALTLALAGAVVGVAHGAALVWLLTQRKGTYEQA